MDSIRIEDLEVFARHGVFEEEVSLGQKFLVSAALYFDASDAGKGDDLTKSIDYAEVCSDITKWMKTNRCRLIETVAERLAGKLLKDHSIVKEVEVTVKKPWAPIGLPLECVSITISRKWHTACIAVGSNMGDREKHLLAGIEHIKKDDNVRVLAVSSFIETKPYGNVDQDDFLNGVVMLETLYKPHELLELVQNTENINGRKRKEHWGPRTLDLDIILYDDLVICESDLVIPHPDMCNRDFVLQPLCEIAPYAYHPVMKRYACTLLEELKEREDRRITVQQRSE
ncbi:MAG: 2-amino-4-hydroxy-6-hydroxymethyldihydropteridine diphosphokinase [Lachnospiraceae bacterium]|nr:2-amino-4-hydroxy-6-hydroxymethyldihydropteridine diphosphokinase [Lachnospiraceae bacterium]